MDLETEKNDIQKNSEEEIRISRNYVKELEEKLDIKTEENIGNENFIKQIEHHNTDKISKSVIGSSKNPENLLCNMKQTSKRESPENSSVLTIFGLSLGVTEFELNNLFSKYGFIEKVLISGDTARGGTTRKFAFVKFESQNDAKIAKQAMNGQEIDGRRIDVFIKGMYF